MTRAQKRLLVSMDSGDGTAYQLSGSRTVYTRVGNGVRAHHESTAESLVALGILRSSVRGRNDTVWERVTG